MRRAGHVFVLAVVLVAATSATAGAGSSDDVRLNEVQILGTHNSFHQRPTDRDVTPGEGADYEHAPLTTQLEQQGIRNLELDAYNGPDLPVFHSLIVDTESVCSDLGECFAELDEWSRSNRNSVPLVLFVEPKPLPTNDNPAIQLVIDAEAERLGIDEWDLAGLEEIDALARDTFGKRLLTPDDVRGKRRTLRAAVLEDGWPTLEETRGNVLIVLNVAGTPELGDLYLDGHSSLRGRAMFVPSEPTDDFAAFVKRDVPDKALIRALVRSNFLVSTRSDANGTEARAADRTRAESALRSGAQVVVTDYPVADPATGTDYTVELPGGRPVRCNPVTAPPGCRDARLE